MLFNYCSWTFNIFLFFIVLCRINFIKLRTKYKRVSTALHSIDWPVMKVKFLGNFNWALVLPKPDLCHRQPEPTYKARKALHICSAKMSYFTPRFVRRSNQSIQDYMCLNISNDLSYIKLPEKKRMEFWDSLYEKDKLV